jgi:uncharacterized protein (DUF952 family)
MAERIYHIVGLAEWVDAVEEGDSYEPPSLALEGFIHCSTRAQVVDTANRLFSGRRDLVLLEVDTALLHSELRLEDLTGRGEPFPHIYGPLNMDAVTRVLSLKPDDQGRFNLPRDLE